jgi:PAS domain S-box-containing protein
MGTEELTAKNLYSEKQERARKQLNSKDLLLHYTEETFVITDVELNIVTFNDRFQEKYNYYLGKTITKGDYILNYAYAIGLETSKDIYLRVLAGETIEAEITHLAPDNCLYTTLNKYKPVYDSQKQIIGIFISCFDTTLTRQAQHEILQNEDKYRSIVENAIDAFFFSNYDGSVISANDAAVFMFGYSKEEFRQLNRTDLIDHSDKQFIAHLQEREKTGKMKGEAIGIRKNGEHFPIEFSSVLYKDNNSQLKVGTFISDISARKKAERKVELNEKRFRSLVENATDILILSDSKNIIHYVSPAFERITGFTLKEVINNPTFVKSRISSDNITQIDKTLSQALIEPNKPFPVLMQFQHKAGHYLWFEGFVTNLLQDENVGAIVSNYRDISERKAAEKELIKSENRFRALAENATDVLILSNEIGIVKYASPAFEKITGFSFEDIRQEPTLLTHHLHPDYHEHAIKTFLEALNNPGKLVTRLLQFQHKNGQYIWMEGVIINLLHDENVKAVVANYRDITERKIAEYKVIKNEKRFRALIEKGEDLIVLTNAAGIISYASPAFEKLTGYRQSEIVGNKNLVFMHTEQANVTQAIFDQLLEKPGLSIPRLNRLKCKDGTYKWVEGYITNLLHDENVQAIVSNYRDITERLQAAEVIKQSENNLKTIFENTTEAFLLIDKKGKVKSFNSNARAIAFLNTPNEIEVGKDAFNFIASDRIDVIKAMFEKVYTGEIIQFDRLYEQENDKIWIDFSIKPVEEDGIIAGICITGRDITARKKAEDELRKRELRFRSILENSHDMLFLFDADGKVEFLSPAIEKVFGYRNDPDEIYHILDSIHPDDLEYAMEQLKEVFLSPEIPITLSFRKKKSDGIYIWLEGTLTNMLHISDIGVVVANFRDITERKKLEEEQAMFSSIVNSSEDAIFSQTLDSQILTWNKGATKLFGYSAEEAIGKECTIIFPFNRFHEENEILEKINKGISIEHFETQRRKKNGELIYISLTVSPIRDSKGNITGASKIARDISDKKRAEEAIINNEKRFRSLLQNSNDGLSLMSMDGVMLEISPAGKKITGFDEKEMIGQARFDLIHPDDLEHVSQGFVDVIENPEKTKNFEYRSLCKDGTYKWLEACCQNLLHEPSVGAIVINYRDITERKNQEIEREQLIKTLHQNNDDLRNFSYITSHNLKAPLSNLMGFINLLEDITIVDPTLRTIIDGFRASTIQLNHTINDLVKILIIRDSNSIEQKEISFGKIFFQVSNQLKNLIEEVKPQINIDFTEAPYVFFNETYLESIFINLLTNSIKYRSYDRELKIDIKSHQNEGGIFLAFSDNGIGFDVERHKTKVFGLYQRFHDRPNSKGLGLYLIKSQMESLQGSIEVDSMVDIGTTFTLKFSHKP